MCARAIARATKSQREPVRAGEQARVVQKEPQRAREGEALAKRKSLWQIYLGHSRAPTASLSSSLRPSVAHYSPLISLIKSFLDSQGPCLARRAAATLTHFILSGKDESKKTLPKDFSQNVAFTNKKTQMNIYMLIGFFPDPSLINF